MVIETVRMPCYVYCTSFTLFQTWPFLPSSRHDVPERQGKGTRLLLRRITVLLQPIWTKLQVSQTERNDLQNDKIEPTRRVPQIIMQGGRCFLNFIAMQSCSPVDTS
jgi:hypothetical protein